MRQINSIKFVFKETRNIIIVIISTVEDVCKNKNIIAEQIKKKILLIHKFGPDLNETESAFPLKVITH